MDDYQVTINTFDRLAGQYQEKYLVNEIYRETYSVFCDLIEPHQKQLLDIGCGPGSVSLYLANQITDLRITGIDPAPAMIELARENIPDGKFMTMDARHIDEESAGLNHRSFDLIVCGFCIPYLAPDDVARFVPACARLLRDEGLLYLSFIEGDSQNSRMMTNDSGDGVFMHFYDVDDIKKQLSLHGFSVINEQRKKLNPEDDKADSDVFLIARRITTKSAAKE